MLIANARMGRVAFVHSVLSFVDGHALPQYCDGRDRKRCDRHRFIVTLHAQLMIAACGAGASHRVEAGLVVPLPPPGLVARRPSANADRECANGWSGES
jgi:hypothetical protein